MEVTISDSRPSNVCTSQSQPNFKFASLVGRLERELLKRQAWGKWRGLLRRTSKRPKKVFVFSRLQMEWLAMHCPLVLSCDSSELRWRGLHDNAKKIEKFLSFKVQIFEAYKFCRALQKQYGKHFLTLGSEFIFSRTIEYKVPELTRKTYTVLSELVKYRKVCEMFPNIIFEKLKDEYESEKDSFALPNIFGI
jgi:hypothetical protein